MAIPKARPTEYRGIVYRSKSEAMFARYLELCRIERSETYRSMLRGQVNAPEQNSGFIYEPQGFDVEDWRPDFLVWNVITPGPKLHLPVATYDFIEYKPAKPTDTYAREFSNRCRCIDAKLASLGRINLLANYYLYWGSPFREPCGAFDINKNTWQANAFDPESADWLSPYRDEILATRFDLEAC